MFELAQIGKDVAGRDVPHEIAIVSDGHVLFFSVVDVRVADDLVAHGFRNSVGEKFHFMLI